MLLPGRYKAENNDNIFHEYSIVMDVKETEKSYIFQLVELKSRYSADHIRQSCLLPGLVRVKAKLILFPQPSSITPFCRHWND